MWPPRRPIGDREALHHAGAVVRNSVPSLRKSKRPWGRLKNCLVCWLLAGGVPGQGVMVEGVKGVKYPPCHQECTKTVKKKAVLCTFWLINCQKRRFLSKVLNKIYSWDVFLRNTLILKFLITYGIVELYLFKFSEVIYAPSLLD